ncbi:MAG: thioredoxin-disulfide reductase [Proteobacteria bacterium]|nr:thioredoxin-disulfide reductase [Pseudomonadota bacterium]
MHTRVLIIGSGPAGYTAAIYAARANLNPIQFLGHQPGGQLTITTEVENYPGFKDAIQGPWLMNEMQQQAKAYGTQMIEDVITKVDFNSRPFKCYSNDQEYTADTVIISTGATARWLGIDSETKFRGAGVSACATCDGFFFKGKDVVVVGGGNTAVEEAIFLTNFANSVTLIHRRDSLRAEKIAQERLFKNPKLKVIWNHTVEEIVGNELPKYVTGAILKSTVDDSTQEIKCDGIFIAIGHTPQSAIFKGILNMDDEGYLLVEKGTPKTNIKGIFAAGDVTDKIYRQAVTAAGLGCQAALDAQRYIEEQEY